MILTIVSQCTKYGTPELNEFSEEEVTLQSSYTYNSSSVITHQRTNFSQMGQTHFTCNRTADDGIQGCVLVVNNGD